MNSLSSHNTRAHRDVTTWNGGRRSMASLAPLSLRSCAHIFLQHVRLYSWRLRGDARMVLNGER